MKIKRLQPIMGIIGLCCLFTACSVDDEYDAYDSVVIEDQNNSHKLSQITFTVSLKDSQNGYLLLSQIDSLTLKINAQQWGVFTSDANDTTGHTDRIINNCRYSDSKTSYLFVARYVLDTDHLETAGDFVNLLKNRIALAPGSYVCELEKMIYKNDNGIPEEKTLQVYQEIKIEEGLASIYLGDIEITLN